MVVNTSHVNGSSVWRNVEWFIRNQCHALQNRMVFWNISTLPLWIVSEPSSLSPNFHCYSRLKLLNTLSTPRTTHQLLQSNARLLTKYSGVRNPTSVTFAFSVPSATSTMTLQHSENSTHVLSLPYSLAIPLLLRHGGTTFLLGTRQELRAILSSTNEFGALFSITTLRGS